MSSLNPPEEVELAERLCEIHPWAEQARFTRGGGEACAVAVRIARATTGRSAVAFCGYHGWHDWYLAANLNAQDALDGHLLSGLTPTGVPRELAGTAYTFAYNDIEALQRIAIEHGNRLAAIIMEPCRYADPDPGFLETVRELAHNAGALLMFDEITIGWRRNFGGAHLAFGVAPDMAVFAKALGNGHPIGAVIGTAAGMDGANESFISSTYWTERVGPVAALATLDVMAKIDVPRYIAGIGHQARTLWKNLAADCGLSITIPEGYPCLPRFAFEAPRANALRTLFTQLMLDEGFLASTAFYPTLAHSETELAEYKDALERVFPAIAQVVANGDIDAQLAGPEAHQGFQRLL